jgi:hypothetical protein
VKGCNLLSKFHSDNLCLLNVILVAAFLFSFLCSVGAVYSAQVTLEWQASSGDIAGYNVYQGTSSRDYDVTLNIGNWTSVTISDLEDGEAYYFSVTAYDLEDNESGYSNEMCINCASQSADQSTTSSSGGDGGGGGCFIITSAYGFTTSK